MDIPTDFESAAQYLPPTWLERFHLLRDEIRAKLKEVAQAGDNEAFGAINGVISAVSSAMLQEALVTMMVNYSDSDEDALERMKAQLMATGEVIAEAFFKAKAKHGSTH